MTTYHHQFEANPRHRIATPRVRTELIARVQREIQLGIYDTDEKRTVTADRIAAEL